jgi:hypothetical protein
MADSRQIQKDLQALREIEKVYSNLEGRDIQSPFANLNADDLVKQYGTAEKAISAIKTQMRLVENETRNVKSGLDDVKGLVDAIGSELGNQRSSLSKVRAQWNKVRGLVTSIYDLQVDIENVSQKDIDKLRKKNKLEFNRLRLLQDQAKVTALSSASKAAEAEAAAKAAFANASNSEADMKKAIAADESYKAAKKKADADSAAYQTTLDSVKAQKSINESLDKTEEMVQKINTGFGPLGKTFVGIGGLLKKAGFGRMAESIEAGEKAMKGLSYELSDAGTKTVSLGDRWKVFRKGITTAFGSLFNIKNLIAGGIVLAISSAVKAFKHLDHEAAELGKNLGLTRTSANEMLESIERAAVSSGDMNLNTDRLLKAQTGISQSLGTTVRLTNQQLADQTYLAEFAGLQADELANSYKASLLIGKSQEAIFNTVVGQNDSIFSANELFKEAVNTTGQIAVNLGNNPAAIAKAVAQAKRLGINLDTARSMADSTLDFESSIAAEMEAQILTGKSLNLNRARELAFQGDQVGAAKEMLRQVGSTEEFSRMNVLAQKSLADAMGLSVDELANQLRESEANAAIEKERQRLIAANVAPREAELRAMAKNQTLGEVFNNIMSKLGDLVSKLVLPAMQRISVAIGDGNEVMKKLKSSFSLAAGAAMDIFKPMDDTKYATASILPSVEKIGDFLGRAFKFAMGIPEQFRKLKNSATFQMISGLFGSKAGKLAIGGAAVGILGKMLTGDSKKGTLKNPMIVSFAAGGILNTIADFLNPKAGSKGPKPKTSALGKVGATISGGIKALGSKLGSVMMKIPGASTVAKGAGAVMKGGKNVMGKMAGSGLAKGLGKVASKGFLKRIPILGSLVGVGYAVKRLTEGDYAGAAMEAGSAGLGLLDLVAPGVGTGLSLAADTAIAARDAGAFGGSEATPLATGGIVQQPTKALVGEAGAEAVIPLREFYAKFDELIAAVNQGGDVMLDGVKVGNTLSLSSYKL